MKSTQLPRKAGGLPDAYTRDGQPIRASQINLADWRRMQILSQSDPEAFVMGCCRGRAVLKTSLYGLQFFAHHANECATAPETQWHVDGKDACIGALRALAINARAEVPGSEIDGSRWEADVFFEHAGRRVVIELQRSYQHFRDFMRRQERYTASGVECYWLLRKEVASPLMKAIGQKRVKEEFGGTCPVKGFFPALPSLPWAMLSSDQKTVQGPMFAAPLEQWIYAVVEKRWAYDGSIWSIAAPVTAT